MPNKKQENFAAEPLTEVPEVQELIASKIREEQAEVLAKPYTIEKITRSCDRSISVNYQTYKVSTTLSATVKDKDATVEDITAMSKEIYEMAEQQTLAEINRIRTILERGN